MELYTLVKTLHVISATIVFGTGIGIASLMYVGLASDSLKERTFATRMTVRADFLFTLPSVIVQPATGLWLVWYGGFDWSDHWLALTYALYLVAALCWIPVVFIQIRLKTMLQAQLQGHAIDQSRFDRLYRVWLMLGWPAFTGLIVIFWLMVAKPTW